MTIMSDIEAESLHDKRAMYNVVVLTIAQAFNYSIAPLTMAIGGLTGSYLLGEDKTFATLPVTFFILGPLFGAFPAAMLMKRIGRRYGFMVGAGLGFIGCGVACYAILDASFALFCGAMLVVGLSLAFAQQYRFAAADFGSNTVKTQALSWVMAGGLLAAVLGPQVSLYFIDFFPLVLFAGSFIGGMILTGIGLCVLFFLKSPPEGSVDESVIAKPARPLMTIIRQPMFLTALMSATTAYMSMALVMTAAPLAMVLCGFSTEQSTNAIQFHIMAMFAPSFFTGALILKYGHARIIGFGMVLFLICSLIALSGIELVNFWAALIALGLAWNFGYVGGSSLVTKTYEPHEQNRVQGVFDSLVFGGAALMSLLSGVILNVFGWNLVLVIVLPLISVCFLILMIQRPGIAAVES